MNIKRPNPGDMWTVGEVGNFVRRNYPEYDNTDIAIWANLDWENRKSWSHLTLIDAHKVIGDIFQCEYERYHDI